MGFDSDFFTTISNKFPDHARLIVIVVVVAHFLISFLRLLLLLPGRRTSSQPALTTGPIFDKASLRTFVVQGFWNKNNRLVLINDAVAVFEGFFGVGWFGARCSQSK